LGKDPAYKGLQDLMKKTVLRVRRPDEGAPRPYDSALVPAVEPRLPKAGLRWSAYPGSFPWVSTVSGRTPAARGSAGMPDVTVMKQAGMLVYEGMVKVPEGGEYQFSIQADGPFLARLHDSLLLDGSYGYRPGAEIAASAMLEAGFHPIRIYFLKTAGSEKLLELQWQGPGMAKAEIPSGSFYYQ
jgi:hypothetical protein